MAGRAYTPEENDFIIEFVKGYDGINRAAFKELSEIFVNRSPKAIEVQYYKIVNVDKAVEEGEEMPMKVVVPEGVMQVKDWRSAMHNFIDAVADQMHQDETLIKNMRVNASLDKEAIRKLQSKVDELESEAEQIARVFRRVADEVRKESDTVLKFDKDSN
jgi:hypothetical protein